MIKVAINGFGRIGKYVAKLLLERTDMRLVAINDAAPAEIQAHLFRYDSVHGRFSGTVQHDKNTLVINGQAIAYSSVTDLNDIDWSASAPDVVIEATGRFTDKSSASRHVSAGARKVLLSAPGKENDIKTILVGINHNEITNADMLISAASCTTNSAGPLLQILDKHCGIESAYITTVHSYTGDQRLHDSPHHDLRRARAGALSIIPTSTGAAKAITRIFSHLEGKIGGCGIRVPVPNGSLTDISCTVREPRSISEINELFRRQAQTAFKGILEYTEEPLVSHDMIGNPHSCVFDAQLTSVIGHMIKVVGWYDNESGYSNRLVDIIPMMA